MIRFRSIPAPALLLLAGLFSVSFSAHPGAAASPTAAARTPAVQAGCGDGLLRDAESCQSCPADCAPKTCTSGDAPTRRFALAVQPPIGAQLFGVTALLAYRSDALAIPGHRADAAVQKRIHTHVKADGVSILDGDYGLSIAILSSDPLPATPLFDVEFDVCTGASATADDLACTLLGCAGAGGPLSDCRCIVTPR